MEVDFYRNVPQHITLHVARMYLEDTTPEGERGMIEDHAPLASRDLGTLHPDLVVFGCTSASAVYGPERDARMRDELSQAVGAPVIGVLDTVLEALDAIKAKKVAVLTPYTQVLNARIVDSLLSYEREVVAIHGLGIAINFEMGVFQMG